MKEHRLTLWAPAKINLSLLVHEKRADGYHEIRSVMQKVSLYDTLTFARAKEVRITSDLKYLPTDERNLCVRAANRYFELTGIDGGVDISLRKAIPVGAGLGGGSSDAACTLRALQQLYRPLEEKVLWDLALSLGADVPFCLSEHNTCLCEGIGEVLTPLKLPREFTPFVLLVKNDRKLSTAQVYGAFDELPHRGIPSDSALIQALQKGEAEALSDNLVNMLEDAVLSQKPELSSLFAELHRLGARGVRMSGAGPTVYGIFTDEASARKAAKAFSETAFCRLANFLV